MRAPSEYERERTYWMTQDQWFDVVDGRIVFKEGTPKRVLDSYNLPRI